MLSKHLNKMLTIRSRQQKQIQTNSGQNQASYTQQWCFILELVSGVIEQMCWVTQ